MIPTFVSTGILRKRSILEGCTTLLLHYNYTIHTIHTYIQSKQGGVGKYA